MRKRYRHKITLGEKECRNVLVKHHIPFLAEYSIETLPYKRFDFMFKYNNKAYVLEFDGQQHFQYCKKYHRGKKTLTKQQENDILKTKMALLGGYNVIRISYKNLQFVELHLLEALKQEKMLYVSELDLYEYILSKF